MVWTFGKINFLKILVKYGNVLNSRICHFGFFESNKRVFSYFGYPLSPSQNSRTFFYASFLESIRLSHDISSMKEKIKENKDKVKVNKTLPYLVANVIELLDVDGEDQEEDGANVDLDAQVGNGVSYLGPFLRKSL